MNRSSLGFFFLLSLLLLDPGPTHPANLYRYHQISMGTVIEILLFSDEEERSHRAALQAFQEIRRIEQLMSPYVETSDLSRLNRAAGKGWVHLSPETIEVLREGLALSERSAGAFDPTIAPLVALWRKAREKELPPSPEDVRRILPLVDFRNLSLDSKGRAFLKKKGMAIDLGAIAKGYAVDRASDLLIRLGYPDHLINAGGDLKARGLKKNLPWSIGIQHPRETDKVLAILHLSDAAVATSGDYEKYFLHQGRRYHHLLNPKTGYPAEGCQSATVVAQSATLADGLATAVFISGPEQGYALCQQIEAVQCLIVDEAGRLRITPGLRGSITLRP